MYPPSELLPERLSEASLNRRRRQKQKRSGQFVLGPIYLGPLQTAAILPGKALIVWVLVLFWSGLEQSRHNIKIRPATLRRFGVSRRAGYRAVEALERAGLIAVRRHQGRAAIVTIKAAKRYKPMREDEVADGDESD
jgi:hypothetical protein